jgi:predicted nuclease of predicted toxin-antitoxin system
MRFKADENLPTEAVAAFRRRGHDADSVVDEGLAGASDSRLADRLRLESRALVTLDVDFGNLKRYAPAEFPGLIVLRLRNQSRQAVLVALERVLDRLAGEPLEGRLWSVDEASIRVHD